MLKVDWTSFLERETLFFVYCWLLDGSFYFRWHCVVIIIPLPFYRPEHNKPSHVQSYVRVLKLLPVRLRIHNDRFARKESMHHSNSIEINKTTDSLTVGFVWTATVGRHCPWPVSTDLYFCRNWILVLLSVLYFRFGRRELWKRPLWCLSMVTGQMFSLPTRFGLFVLYNN